MSAKWISGFGIVFAASLCASPVFATILMPGETLLVRDLPDANVTSPASWPSGTAYENIIAYERAPIGQRRDLVEYNGWSSQQVVLAGNGAALAFGLFEPQFGQHPASPSDPIIHLQPLPAGSRISISGFGVAPLDVSRVSLLDVEGRIGSISRSADGDVVTFGDFSSNSDYSSAESLVDVPQIVLEMPGLALGHGVATVQYTDLEGQTRVQQLASFAPVPEPASLGLFLFGLGALGWRLGRRRGVE